MKDKELGEIRSIRKRYENQLCACGLDPDGVDYDKLAKVRDKFMVDVQTLIQEQEREAVERFVEHMRGRLFKTGFTKSELVTIYAGLFEESQIYLKQREAKR